MQILVNSREMKECDANTIQYFQVPSLVLMERAALGVVEAIETWRLDCSDVLIACGMGNNGGDGLAVARLLHQKGCAVTVLLAGTEAHASEETKRQLAIVRQYGISTVQTLPQKEYTLIVDALFGIGLSRAVTGAYAELIEALNERRGAKLAIDIPSGISGDQGQILGCAFRADLTVTFAYKKVGLLLYPGSEYAGTVVVRPIGIGRASWREREPSVWALEPADLALLPKRRAHSNKGSYGHVLVIGGTPGMAGAALFSGRAAAVTGCGLVKILTWEENRVILQQQFPEAVLDLICRRQDFQAPAAPMSDSGVCSDEADTKRACASSGTSAVFSDAFFARLERNLRWADAVVIGPGLGISEEAAQLLTAVWHLHTTPLIVDADALNLLAQRDALWSELAGEVIVTPHLGEMARLTGRTIESLQADLLAAAGAFAAAQRVICVCKDARTVTALPNGACYLNTSGNHGMATAGAGDVLTGVLAGLVAQGLSAAEAAPLGVYLHGLGGDAARRKTGAYGMLAGDIIEGIREVLRETERKQEDEHLQQSICGR